MKWNEAAERLKKRTWKVAMSFAQDLRKNKTAFVDAEDFVQLAELGMWKLGKKFNKEGKLCDVIQEDHTLDQYIQAGWSDMRDEWRKWCVPGKGGTTRNQPKELDKLMNGHLPQHWVLRGDLLDEYLQKEKSE